MAGVPEELDAVVVGAGFAGLYALHKLRQQGLSVTVFEAADDIGGTWYWNRYPGARCDVHSLDYSFSFDPQLQQDWEWTEKYASQPEILSYLNHVADRYDLRTDVVLETRVTQAHYDEATSRWTIRTDRGHEVSARFCVLAVGSLSVPKFPEVPGLETFAGPAHHTGLWPEDAVDLTGKRVAVLGSGSSGIQITPELAGRAGELTVFQRTPQYSVAGFNAPLDPAEVAEVKARYAEYRETAKQSVFGITVEPPTRSALELDDEARRAFYQERWDRGHLNGFVQSFTDLIFDPEANETAQEFVREKVRERVADPETAGKLEPRGYPFSTKRPCVDHGYYESFNRDNVRLVDLREEDLVEITETGIRTTAGDYEFDVLVLATGFDAMTGALLAIDIQGKEGLTLREKWHDGPETYLGLSVTGFPNLFTIAGPGSPSVLSNMVLSIEHHVDWISDLLDHLARTDRSVVEAADTAAKEWTGHVREVSEMTLFPHGNSYYQGANVPGKPRVFMPYAGGVPAYRDKCQQVADNGYDGFELE
jgi:cation diffusion facilitator CzcD-associated flavoprotein CzcO